VRKDIQYGLIVTARCILPRIQYLWSWSKKADHSSRFASATLPNRHPQATSHLTRIRSLPQEDDPRSHSKAAHGLFVLPLFCVVLLLSFSRGAPW